MKLFSQIVQANLFSEWNALMCFLMLGYSLKVFSQCGQVKYHFLYVHKHDLWGLKPVQILVSILGNYKEYQVGHAFWYVLLEHYLSKIVCHNQYTQEVLYRFLHGQPHVFSVSHQLQRFCSKSHIYELALTVSLNSHLMAKWGIHVLLHARQDLTMCHTDIHHEFLQVAVWRWFMWLLKSISVFWNYSHLSQEKRFFRCIQGITLMFCYCHWNCF